MLLIFGAVAAYGLWTWTTANATAEDQVPAVALDTESRAYTIGAAESPEVLFFSFPG